MAIFDRNDVYQALNYEKNILPYIQEYQNTTLWDRLTGGSESVIYGKTSKAGQGDEIVYTQRQNFDPTVKIGSERLAGAEDQLVYGVDKLRVGYFRFGTLINNKFLQELQINHRFDPDVRAQLLYQGGRLNSHRIVRQFGLAFSENNRGLPNQQYTFAQLTDKMIACGIDTPANGECVSSSRLMFGSDKGLDQATVGDALTQLSDASAYTLTVEHLFNLAALAEEGSRTNIANKEHPIRPHKFGQNHMGYPERSYMYITCNRGYKKLLEDPDWKNQLTRGVIERESQPSELFNSIYKGSIHGVGVYVFPEMSNYIFTHNGQEYAYGAFLGAGAVALGLGESPRLIPRSDEDYGIITGLAHVEISDAKVLKFPSKEDLNQKGVNSKRVENGLIHSFIRL